MMDPLTLMQGGVAGIAIAALMYVIKRFIKLLENHMSHSTEMIGELKVAITELKDFLLMSNGKR